VPSRLDTFPAEIDSLDSLDRFDRFDRFFERDERLPASVTVTRTSHADVKTRQLVPSIDGITLTTLLWGDSISCELEPGRHRLRVHNTLVWKTVDFVITPGEQAFFEVINRTGLGTLAMTVVFGIGPLYVTIQRM
jgi:hypothetical protein